MSSKAQLQPVRESGPLMGFANLFRKENGQWWGTRSWLVQAIIWTALINGILLSVLTVQPKVAERQPANGVMNDRVTTATMIFSIFAGMATGVGAVIVMQDAIIDEKKLGTAAWVLSKPVSRLAFVLSKLLANGIACLLIMIALQGLIAGILIGLTGGGITAVNWAAGTLLLALHLLFYITLTLMLGAFFSGRGPVIGLPMFILFGSQFVMGVAPALARIMPWVISMPPGGENTKSLAMMVLMGQPVTDVLPIVATAIWCVVFTAAACWRFEREEF